MCVLCVCYVCASQVAMARTKKLCAVVVDTLGREVMVRRPCVFGPDGWPAHPGECHMCGPSCEQA